MQTVFLFYCIGLLICVLLGVLLSLLIFQDLRLTISNLVPQAAGQFLSRMIKILFIFTALIGGISAKFYGCDYKYSDLVNDPTALSLKVGGQIEAALRYLLVFLLLVLGIFVVAAAMRTIKGKKAKG